MARVRNRRVETLDQQRLLEDAANSLVEGAKITILEALRDLTRIHVARVIEQIREGGDVRVVIEKAKKPPAVEIGMDALRRSFSVTFEMGVRSGRQAAQVDLPFEARSAARRIVERPGTSRRAAEWADKRAAKLVAEIGRDTRDAIRSIVSEAVRQGRPPGDVADSLRDVIGLDSRRAMAVENFRAAQLRSGVDSRLVQQRAERYAERLLDQRAEMIARTETFRAVNEGRDELWRELADEKIIDGSKAKRVWLSSRDERVDDICAELDGEEATLTGDFPGGYGAPPDPHPGCRCTIVLEIA